jgi:SAM-dependent methyltransferase
MSDPYAQIAAFYEEEFREATVDAQAFATTASRVSTLVLGCGTGRITRVLASDRPVVGLDLSSPMLDEARKRDPSSRYVEGDMRAFRVGRFGAIVIPNASFNFLLSRDDQARCLSACAAALEPDGELWIDVPMPDFTWWAKRHTPEKPAWTGIVDGRPASRTREVTREPELQRLDLHDRYFVGGELAATSVLRLRLLLPGEMEWMLEANGWYAEDIWGDHQFGRVREGCPRILVRARLYSGKST